MALDLDLLKTIRETADWLLALPDKLVEAVTKPRETWGSSQVRMGMLRELSELDEVAKAMANLYLSKGSIIGYLEAVQREKDLADARQLRGLFLDVAFGLRGIRDTLGFTSVGSARLGAEAALVLTRAESAYARLANAPDEDLLGDPAIIDIGQTMEALIGLGRPLLDTLDDRRRLIRGHYAGFVIDPSPYDFDALTTTGLIDGPDGERLANCRPLRAAATPSDLSSLCRASPARVAALHDGARLGRADVDLSVPVAKTISIANRRYETKSVSVIVVSRVVERLGVGAPTWTILRTIRPCLPGPHRPTEDGMRQPRL